MAAPVLQVGDDDLQRRRAFAPRADLRGLDASHRRKPLAGETGLLDARVGGHQVHAAGIEQHAALDVGDQDRDHVFRAAQQVDHQLPELEVARLEVAVEALRHDRRRDERVLTHRRLEADAAGVPAGEQQVARVRELHHDEGGPEHDDQPGAEAAAQADHGWAVSAAGCRSPGRRASVTGGSQRSRRAL